MNGVESGGEAQSGRDRRRYARASLRLPARYLLEDGSEHACECLDLSIGGLRLKAAKAGPWGSKVIAYVEGVGRVEGYVIRRAPGWFAIEVHATERKESRLAERIDALLARSDSQADERRGAPRFGQAREAVILVSQDGLMHEAELADISAKGAAVLTEGLFEVGDQLGIGEKTATVIRVFPGGLALQFERAPRERKSPRGRWREETTREVQPAEG